MIEVGTISFEGDWVYDQITEFWKGCIYTLGALLVLVVVYGLSKFDSWRRRNMWECNDSLMCSLKRVPITPDKNWQIVGKTNPVTLDQVPLLVKEMRESFLTHK